MSVSVRAAGGYESTPLAHSPLRSLYDGSADGPADTSEKPRGAREDSGWRCPMSPAHASAYRGHLL